MGPQHGESVRRRDPEKWDLGRLSGVIYLMSAGHEMRCAIWYTNTVCIYSHGTWLTVEAIDLLNQNTSRDVKKRKAGRVIK